MARLNRVEELAMNNPVRRAALRWAELPGIDRLLHRHRVDLRGTRILDAGCGEGWSTMLLRHRYDPTRLVGIDLMPEQIERARRRGVPGAEFRVGDVSSIEEPHGSFDAVFELGILHHVPKWREALAEFARVLAPGGWLIAEDLSGRFIAFSDAVLRTSHPREVRLDWRSFREAMREVGFEVVDEARVLGMPFARRFLARRRG